MPSLILELTDKTDARRIAEGEKWLLGRFIDSRSKFPPLEAVGNQSALISSYLMTLMEF